MKEDYRLIMRRRVSQQESEKRSKRFWVAQRFSDAIGSVKGFGFSRRGTYGSSA
jgi:hypothetical protein